MKLMDGATTALLAAVLAAFAINAAFADAPSSFGMFSSYQTARKVCSARAGCTEAAEC
jgi:hypothetical protein